MKYLKVASVQFEHQPSDKAYNFSVMEKFIRQAAEQGVNVISFPEMCLTGYTHLTAGTPRDFARVAEPVPEGKSIQKVLKLARTHDMLILFGMVETNKVRKGTFYNTFVACTPDGKVYSHRKIHAFEHSCVLPGNRYVVFDYKGWKMGMLICYDNNIPENVICLALKGVEVVFAPHQTGGFDIEIAGMGRIPKKVWLDREKNPTAIRKEILGPKGREWLLKWLPSRAYDNNVFYVFSNGVGIDGDDIRTGNAMILDPHGCIMAESMKAGDDMVVATLDKKSRERSLGKTHMTTRRTDLFAPVVERKALVNTRDARNQMISSHKIK